MNFNQTKDIEFSVHNYPDFEFLEYNLLTIDVWEKEYEKKNLSLFDYNGQTKRLNKGFNYDEFHKSIFNYLLPILTKYE